MDQIIIASENKGKIAEFKALCDQKGMFVLSLADLTVDIPEIEETGATFQENAQIKAETVSTITKSPVIADDSGLVIDALDGRPGIYSARYAGEPTNDVKNYEKVLREMKKVDKLERTARFTAVLALARPNKKTVYFEGHCEGRIAFEPRGTSGFGYDPIFVPDGYEQTMAELAESVKNKISHRYHALEKLADWL